MRKRLSSLPVVFILCVLTAPCFGAGPDVRDVVTNPITGVALGDFGGWIYKSSSDKKEWAKLIPGICPQWYPDGKRFVFFLPIGYSVSAQLWSADATGEARYILSKSEYFIASGDSPVVSMDSKEIAYHYSTCHQSGFYEDIVVIDLREMRYPSMICDAKVVYRAKPYSSIRGLRWIDRYRLQVTVNGKTIMIDTHVKGEEQRS